MEEPIREEEEEKEEKEDEKEGLKQNRENYNEKYKKLISEYKQQILRLDLCPLQLAKRLEDQKVISKMDLQYINSLTLPKWQMEILFEFLLHSRCDQLGQVKAALKHYADDGTEVMFKIFEEITVRGQHILREAREQGVSPKLPKVEPDLPTDTWLPYQLFEAAYEGNVKQLVEVFAYISSLQKFLNLIEGVGKELTGNGVSPLHVACAMGGVKADFVDSFTRLIQLLINSEMGTLNFSRMLSFKSFDADGNGGCPKNKFGAGRKNFFVEVRTLEDFLNLKDSWGNSALHWAAKTRATDLAKFLYNQRADLFIENDEGDTPLEILYEISPEVVVCILNDHIPPVTSLTKREREDEEVSLDMISITGCRSRVSLDESEGREPVDSVETQLLAQMVLGNMEESSKQILPHVLVKTFLDEKWKKLVAPIFILTAIYILFHLLHTIFIVQVFIVSHPYRSTNGSAGGPMLGHGEESGKNMSQDFYNYLLGNWDSPDSIFSTETSTLSKDLAMVSKVTSILMLIAESFEIWATALCVSHTRDDGLRPRMERKWAARRKIDLVIVIILSSIYERDTWRVFVSSVLLMPLYIYDWVVITSNSRDKNQKRKFSAFVIFKLVKIAISSAIIILSIFPPSGLTPDGPTNVAWLTILVAGGCILMEIFGSLEFLINKLMEMVSATFQKVFEIFLQRKQQDSNRSTTPQSFPLMGSGAGNDDDQQQKNDEEVKLEGDGGNTPRRTGCKCHVERGLVNFLVTFWRGALAYLTNLENVLQLTYIAIIIFVSDSVHRGTLTKGLYRGAAVSVVLAWILILLQIGHVYGLGKYIHMLRTVVKSFLAVMGIYLSLLVAFSLSFSIVFPNESRFESLPSSFFRVVSMMAGELNYDDIFYPENPQEEWNAFPYASQWLHLIFVLGVVIVLINLLIGLTVNDIQKIQEKSDVIYRTVQVERLYIMEIFFQMFSKFLSSMMCCCCFWRKTTTTTIKFSNFNVLRGSSSKMLIKWSRLSPTLQEEFLQATNQLEEDEEKAKTQKDDRDPHHHHDPMTNLSLQISAVFQDRDQIENLPLPWLFAFKNDPECQEKICSISSKDRLTANPWNLTHLTQLSKFSVKLKILRICLEKCDPHHSGDDGTKIWSQCQKILLTILLKNKDTLSRLEVDWSCCFPPNFEFPQLPQLTSLLLISPNKSDLDTVEVGGELISNFNLDQKFPNLSSIEISGPSLFKLDELDGGLLLPKIFPRDKSHKKIKNLTLSMGDFDGNSKIRIELAVFERLRNIFPKIERLEIEGGLKWMPPGGGGGGEDLVPKLWKNLKLVFGGDGDTWIQIPGGSEKSSPDTSNFGPWDSDSLAGLFPVPNVPEVNDAAGPALVIGPQRPRTTSDESSSGPSRFGSGLTERLKNFWSKSVAEDEYPLDGNGMGYILIINNLFDDPSQQDNLTYINLERGRGAWEDGVKVDRLFRDLNFRTRMERNVGSQELPEILEDFKSEVIRYGYHSCFVFVLGHGLQQVDGSTSILMDDLVSIDLFKNIIHPLIIILNEKSKNEIQGPDAVVHFDQMPKAFFVHFCQNWGEAYYDDESSQWSRSSAASISHQLLPGVTNTLLCRSVITSPIKTETVRGQRRLDGSSLFIEAMDRVFREKANASSLQEMMAMVTMYVQERSNQRQGPMVNYFGFNRQYRFQNLKKL